MNATIAMNLSPHEVATLQLQLKLTGDYPGLLHGIFDDPTRDALARFQTRARVGTVSGVLDASTRVALDRNACATFDDQLLMEVEELAQARPPELKTRASAAEPGHPDLPRKVAHDARLVGLAFSGGGIRSATFNLGVLQALSELKLLHLFDYLSTVSGGGYIGSWLSALVNRRGGELDRVASELAPQGEGPVASGRAPRSGAYALESAAIRFLRSYSNYLTPRLGVLSADTLEAVATYVRNLLLNVAILILLMVSALLVPRILTAGSRYLKLASGSPGPTENIVAILNSPGPLANVWLVLGVILLFLSTIVIGMNFAYSTYRRDGPPPGYTQPGAVLAFFWIPGTVGAYLVSYWLTLASAPAQLLEWYQWVALGSALYGCAWLFGTIGYLGARPSAADRNALQRAGPDDDRRDRLGTVAFWALVAGAVGGLLCYWFARLLGLVQAAAGVRTTELLGVGLGTILLIFNLSLVVGLHVGLVGRSFSDDFREWWSRLGGFGMYFGVIWLVFFVFAIYIPPLVHSGTTVMQNAWVAGGASLTWLLSTLAGVFLGKSERTGTGHVQRALDVVARVTPFVFILGLLIGLSLLIHVTVTTFEGSGGQCSELGGNSVAAIWDRESCAINAISIWTLLGTAAGFLAAGLLLSWRVDINLFSLHNFYRFRLTRCYLGATRVPNRHPQPFTGFDPDDDLPLHTLASTSGGGHLRSQRPYQIVNTALNIVRGRDLEWQQRKAASFTFTPKLCGFELPPAADSADAAAPRTAEPDAPSARGCFRPSARMMGPGGAMLGTALAVSGAAASPNMGYHSSPALAFLMTVFNVRLGRWCGNPATVDAWKDASPGFAARYLLYELLGMTTSTTRYVYLSDGGHFENLALYELVRRRCRLIVASDAGQDQQVAFEDLGNAIRKCNVDLGVPIEIDVSPLRPRGEQGHAEWHCAVGAIRYDLRDPGAAPGVLLYLKPSLAGDEPADLLHYAASDPTFPHQSTNDQWFDESQFESYRKLGYHIGLCALRRAKEMAEANAATATDARADRAFRDVEGLLVALRQVWRPPAFGGAEAFTRHSKTLDAIYDRLRREPPLHFLDAQIYPNWDAIAKGTLAPEPAHQWLPKGYGELREGFYLCNSVIQLMENVYLDLRLDTQHDHPDNRGWMNLFRHWAWCNMFRVTWAMSASTYGARFQNFCKQRLGLDLGRVEAVPLPQHIAQLLAPTCEELNFLEKRLVEELLDQHPALPPQELRVHAFELVVDDPQEAGRRVRFRFGFAVTIPADGSAAILYFRIQNHLRRMGLGRWALRELLRPVAAPIGVCRQDLAEPAPEPIGKPDYERFERLLCSVLYELDKQ